MGFFFAEFKFFEHGFDLDFGMWVDKDSVNLIGDVRVGSSEDSLGSNCEVGYL